MYIYKIASALIEFLAARLYAASTKQLRAATAVRDHARELEARADSYIQDSVKADRLASKLAALTEDD